jgi:hypothetical protein
MLHKDPHIAVIAVPTVVDDQVPDEILKSVGGSLGAGPAAAACQATSLADLGRIYPAKADALAVDLDGIAVDDPGMAVHGFRGRGHSRMTVQLVRAASQPATSDGASSGNTSD